MLRGEIWRLSLASGQPQKKEDARLVVLLTNDALGILPLRVVVPLTPWKEAYRGAPWMAYIPPVLRSGLEQAHAADALQVRSISSARLMERVGELPDNLVDGIARAVETVIRGG
jgi:mRNA interferase MazF